MLLGLLYKKDIIVGLLPGAGFDTLYTPAHGAGLRASLLAAMHFGSFPPRH